MQRGSLSIRSWRTQCDWGYSLVVMTQTVKEYLACSWQLTADGFYLHTVFLTKVIDPSLSLWMTFYRILHHDGRSFTFAFGWRLTFPSLWHFPFPIVRVTCFPPIVILTFRVTPSNQYPPSGFAGHLLINKEAYPIPILTVGTLS